MTSTPDVRRVAGYRGGLALGIALVTFGCGRMYFDLLRPAWDVYRARQWVSAKVKSSDAEIYPFHGMVHARFKYDYEFRGRIYEGRRYAFLHPTTYVDEDAIFEMQDTLPTHCYVDPTVPSRAVLVRDLPLRAYRWSGATTLLIGAIFAAWVRRLRVLSTTAPDRQQPTRWTDGAVRELPVWTLRIVSLFFAYLALRIAASANNPVRYTYMIVQAALAIGLWPWNATALRLAAGSCALWCSSCLALG